ncbi:hypothetical protein G8A07_15705 [Roseateles sp. DAIF2]|uniref:hypothetical protein n=1 Tax=Roseateles sp. DAIF2 TaxID=2714952 RepID=UPI0018A26646|nr:hypothetical protein [Roseateles sp. DAIF2]QPF74220.1 hypothetical protein G8A07_15705 [Roseateles sp. DAIF2]
MSSSRWLACAAVAISANAWAVQKCTLPDGRVVYQDAPCSTGAASSQQVDVVSASGRPGDSWEFSRQKDDMTGTSSCFATSPAVYTNYRSVHAKLAYVWVQLHMTPKSEQPAFTVRTSSSSSDLFHHDLSGTGIKVDRHEFQPFTQRVAAHALSFTSEATETEVVQQMSVGQDLRLRLRFWPYDKLHDTEPVSLRGFKQAASRMRACAKS